MPDGKRRTHKFGRRHTPRLARLPRRRKDFRQSGIHSPSPLICPCSISRFLAGLGKKWQDYIFALLCQQNDAHAYTSNRAWENKSLFTINTLYVIYTSGKSLVNRVIFTGGKFTPGTGFGGMKFCVGFL